MHGELSLKKKKKKKSFAGNDVAGATFKLKDWNLLLFPLFYLFGNFFFSLGNFLGENLYNMKMIRFSHSKLSSQTEQD